MPTQRISKAYLFITLGTFSILILGGLWFIQLWQKQQPSQFIAVVGPMSGQNANKGAVMVDSATLLIEQYNRNRLDNQPALKLKVFDDRNLTAQATAKAVEISEDDRILAVLGHRSSTTTAAALPIYQSHNLPIISGTATADNLADLGDYFFRTAFNNGDQARFIASYIATVLQKKRVSIIYASDSYGQAFAHGFTQAANEFDLTLAHQWQVTPVRGSIKTELPTLLQNIKRSTDPGMIFLAIRDIAASELITHLRDAQLEIPLIGGTSIGKQSFPQRFVTLPAEQKFPGFYSDGIYAATGLIFDAAGEKAQRFRHQFQQRFGYQPDAAAAAYYDATAVLVDAIRQIGTQTGYPAKQLRQQIQRYLAKINNLDNAVQGITGPFYFDDVGNAVKPISIGQYHKQRLISAPSQLYLANQATNVETNNQLVLGKQPMRQGHIAYTGLRINNISAPDPVDFSHDIEFMLWFRANSGINPADIEFLNAVEPITLGEPIETITQNHQTYQAYRVKGRFKGNFLTTEQEYGEHLLGIQFRHRSLERNQLLYVTDSTGMPIDQGNNYQLFSAAGSINIGDALRVDRISLYQDQIPAGASGLPQFTTSDQPIEMQSRFNVAINVSEARLLLRKLIPESLTYELLLGAITLFLLLHIIRKSKYGMRYPKILWVTQVISIYLALICLEATAVYSLNSTLDNYQIAVMLKCFDAVWWICGAILMMTGIRQILWIPLEVRTGQKPPRIIQALLVTLACTIAGFGIIAFVLGYELTSVLATSGILAMIIGLAIQMNISNFFSGIAINLERPFRVGDFIEVGDLGAGYVTDITWRTTRLRTKSGEVISIPNTQGAESTVINYSLHGGHYNVQLLFHIDPQHNPSRVIDVISQALRHEAGQNSRIIEEDEIDIGFEGVNSRGAEYRLYIKTINFMREDPAIDIACERIWHALNDAGIQQLSEHTWFLSQRTELHSTQPQPT